LGTSAFSREGKREEGFVHLDRRAIGCRRRTKILFLALAFQRKEEKKKKRNNNNLLMIKERDGEGKGGWAFLIHQKEERKNHPHFLLFLVRPG